MPIRRRRVEGLNAYAFSHHKDKKLVKGWMKTHIEEHLNRKEKRYVRKEIIGAAKDKGGVTGREMGEIAIKMIKDADPIQKKKARHIRDDLREKGAITSAEWRYARRKYLTERREAGNKSSNGVAKPYGQREDDDDDRPALRGMGAGSSDGDVPPPAPIVNIPRRPMF